MIDNILIRIYKWYIGILKLYFFFFIEKIEKFVVFRMYDLR